MQKWELALNNFLKRYINKPWFQGAVLCGSYSVGNQNKFSDIDITIVASDDIGWNTKGNCYVDGFLIEYLINPVYKYKMFMESDFKNNHKMLIQNMFANGIILIDKNGMVKNLHQIALKYYKRKMKPFAKNTLNRIKYGLWCKYDDMLSLNNEGYPIDLVYWSLVGNLITAYCDFKCLPHMPIEKIQKMLMNPEYAKRYHAEQLPDKNFTNLLMACFNAKPKDKIPAIDKLYKFVIKSGGGFEIGNFINRIKIDKK